MIAGAASISERTHEAFIATAGASGSPHIVLAKRVRAEAGGSLSVVLWPCPRTMSNLAANPRLCVVCYDPEAGRGIQLTGTVRQVRDIEMIDGAAQQAEAKVLFPQAERMISMDVDTAADIALIEKESV